MSLLFYTGRIFVRVVNIYLCLLAFFSGITDELRASRERFLSFYLCVPSLPDRSIMFIVTRASLHASRLYVLEVMFWGLLCPLLPLYAFDIIWGQIMYILICVKYTTFMRFEPAPSVRVITGNTSTSDWKSER